MEIIKPSDPNSVVAVAHRRLFTRGTNFKVFAGKVLVFSLGSRLRKVVAHRGSTVQYTHLDHWHFELNCNTTAAIAQIQTSSSCLSKTYC